jgi:hypothetical protein
VEVWSNFERVLCRGKRVYGLELGELVFSLSQFAAVARLDRPDCQCAFSGRCHGCGFRVVRLKVGHSAVGWNQFHVGEEGEETYP